MDQSQSLNAPPFLCLIDEAVWDAVEIGWTRPEAAKSTWDKAALTVSNANSKAFNAIFVVCHQMSSIGFLTLPLPRRHGRYWRPLMRERRK